MKIHVAIFALPLWYSLSVSASMIDSDNLHTLIKQCAPEIKAESKVAYGIVKTESAGNPFAIGINTKGIRLKRQPHNIIEAVEISTWLAKNRYNFDAGIAQINSVNINKFVEGDLNFRMQKVFNPCDNLKLAEKIYNSCFEMTGSMVGALSCYNTGTATKGIKNGYVARVLANIPDLLEVRGSSSEPYIGKSRGKRLDASKSKPDAAGVDENKSKPKAKDDGVEDVFAAGGTGDVFSSECIEGENQKCDND
ncbi:lytic transglycosylase domain-containing protein [Salmonella enterica]|nr:lytic transglycosylase domain-containing protein [Salmonella enterica]EEP3373105.1 lytic transglycosylase domain-containing protein [Salmonella enterica]EFP6579665.1 lytic transglycosylase domain-containing protein [Salmonella enterica]EGC7971432.1 lytic transglycosylase domain-containing protein [Salmonella enterica]EIV4461657.1 lytic transglycosylase domain-containing protein [Salmonella enterica]